MSATATTSPAIAKAPPGTTPGKDFTDGEDSGPDAFGQTGVRQYFMPAIAWACFVAALVAAAMWYRSSFYTDAAFWYGADQTINVASVKSRLIVEFDQYAQKLSKDSGWSYKGRYTHDVRDQWANSIWKTIGFEMRFSPMNTAASSGFWLRVRWPTVFGVLLIVPVLRGALWVRRGCRVTSEQQATE